MSDRSILVALALLRAHSDRAFALKKLVEQWQVSKNDGNKALSLVQW